jgi:hypothetical protein
MDFFAKNERLPKEGQNFKRRQGKKHGKGNEVEGRQGQREQAMGKPPRAGLRIQFGLAAYGKE